MYKNDYDHIKYLMVSDGGITHHLKAPDWPSQAGLAWPLNIRARQNERGLAQTCPWTVYALDDACKLAVCLMFLLFEYLLVLQLQGLPED